MDEADMESCASEIDMALEHLRRAIVSEKVHESMLTGKPVLSTPITDELEKQILQLENIKRAYGLEVGP